MDDPEVGTSVADLRCAECEKSFDDDRGPVVTDAGSFCQGCFDSLSAQLQSVMDQQGAEINWPMAFVGGLAGAVLGVVTWWGFTAVTNIAFGLVAIVIGYAVGNGVRMLSGNKRSMGLQIMSVSIASLAFFYATYLVNRTFIIQGYAEQGETIVLPLLPDPTLLFEVIKIGFGIMDVVFLGIVIFEAWRRPAPMKLTG
jgi:hypothetical protein